MFADSKFKNELKGEWDAESVKLEERYARLPSVKFTHDMLKAARKHEQTCETNEHLQQYVEKATTEHVHIGGPEYHEGAEVMECIVHKPNDAKESGNRCIIYFHGGGACVGSAIRMRDSLTKMAVLTNSVIINCNYRLCPDVKFPSPIFDAYSCVKHVIEHADEFCIDKTKIALSGESAGGCIQMGVA